MLKRSLLNLQGKIFKLLPMREDFDAGCDNHLKEYVNGLLVNIIGLADLYPELENHGEYVDVKSNIAYLLAEENVPFLLWRNITLKSTRLIQAVIERIGGD